MKGILKLRNPITAALDGKVTEVKELPYDTEEITGVLMAEAAGAYQRAMGGKKAIMLAETEVGLHQYYGCAAIIAVNPGLDFSELEKVKGYDAVEVMKIGRNFILTREGQTESNSDEQPEPTASGSTQA